MLKHTKTKSTLAVSLLALASPLMAGEPLSAKQVIYEQEDGWEFSISPYFLAAGLSGDVGFNGLSTGVDAAFDDLKDQLDAGAAGYFEARKGKWGFGLDAFWLKLSGDNSFRPIPMGPVVDASVELEEVRAKAVVYYRTHETDRSSFDIYGGATYNYVDTQIDISGGGMLGLGIDGRTNDGWFDPVIGARYSHAFNDKWFTRLLGEVGGFGTSSDFNWEAMALLGYHINDRWDLGLAYRGIGIDYEDDGFIYDVTMHGPMLGFSYNW